MVTRRLTTPPTPAEVDRAAGIDRLITGEQLAREAAERREALAANATPATPLAVAETAGRVATPLRDALAAGFEFLSPDARGVEVLRVAATSSRRVEVTLAIPTTPGRAAEVAHTVGLALDAEPHQVVAPPPAPPPAPAPTPAARRPR